MHLIADYGEKDPAFSEVVHRLKSETVNVDVQTTAVPKFSTVATGFWIRQIGLEAPEIQDSVVYANTAPRRNGSNAHTENRGRNLVFARLENGVPVLAVNSGYSLSFVRNEIEEFRKVEVPSEGSQFRSRDYFPKAVTSVLEGEERLLGEELDISEIPEVPASKVAFVDGYGNIKTTIRRSQTDLEEGQRLRVKIGDETRQAFYEAGTFSVEEGEISYAPGSSGGEDPFMEVFLRGGSASEAFGEVKTLEDVEVEVMD